MVTKGLEISSLQLAGEGTIPVQETNPAASSKMVAGIQWPTCSHPPHQETGQGTGSMLVSLRVTREPGTQQEAATLPMASTSVTSQQEVDPHAPSIMVTGISSTKTGSSVEYTHALYSEAVEEANPRKHPS